eukprot:GHVU01226741.1.p1 GENE.GHVU01226741.1~~GHVU01226741.1.p1  ORF type:complete len:251 (-),score=30.69 GHVU01226741.1:628-1380(-)
MASGRMIHPLLQTPVRRRIIPAYGDDEDDGELYDSSFVNVDELIKRPKPDDYFVTKMANILSGYPNIGTPPEPSQLLGHLFLGSRVNAENPTLLRKYRFTHMLNCTAYRSVLGKANPLPPDTKVRSQCELSMDEDFYHDFVPNLMSAATFIDRAGTQQGRVLLYCSGVNCSSAIAIGYLVKSRIPLLEATRYVKDARRVALSQEGFMEKLTDYARSLGMLDKEPDDIPAPTFGRKLDMKRLNTVHLPMFL